MIECQALAQAIPQHPARKEMREAVEAQRALRAAGNGWKRTANMRFHKGVVALADSERLNTLFSHLLVELRLAFGMLSDAEFLHAPYIDMNATMLERFEAGDMKRAAEMMHELPDPFRARGAKRLCAAHERCGDGAVKAF